MSNGDTAALPSMAAMRQPALDRGHWRHYLRAGDWLTLAALAALTASSFALYAKQAPVDRAVIRRDGVVVAEVMLAVNKTISVDGPLGTTTVEIEPGRARIAADPGPRQLCVRQGWLERVNATALCLPNHVSLQVLSAGNRHDSIVY